MIVVKGRQGPQSEAVGSDMIMLGSNDYLVWPETMRSSAGGSRPCRHGTGLAMNQLFATTPCTNGSERRWRFYGTEAALLFALVRCEYRGAHDTRC